MNEQSLKYQYGFGNFFKSEAIANALPSEQNAPQKTPLGLYAEQLSGTTFLAPRSENLYSWLYRIYPSVKHSDFQDISYPQIRTAPLKDQPAKPNQYRWNPLPFPQKNEKIDFLSGLKTILVNGNADAQAGCAVHLYSFNTSMTDKYFYNSDGDFLIVPQEGKLRVKTEFGILEVEPTEILVLPRGIKFQVETLDDQVRGYICENYGAFLRTPNLGPIGSNGLAYPDHFEYPIAWYEDLTGEFELITKFHGNFFSAKIDHSPLNVVAWKGNYVPYKYDLKKFNVINTVSFDHPDPSIFTVLTSPSETAASNLDFVIFPPRWMVAENTFRPPYYHRNIMSEYMGLIIGSYDAKTSDGDSGFVPGGGSLHNCMTSHGPDAQAFTEATNAKLEPKRYKDTLAFMFESKYPFVPTEFALKGGLLQGDYMDCWQGLKKNFKQ